MNNLQGLCIDEAHHALRILLMMRDKSITHDHQSAIMPARHALKLAQDGDPNMGGTILPRDLVRAHWLLGAALRADGHFDDADHHLTEALARCRGINMVDHEADILLDLARLRWDEAQTCEVSETSQVSRRDEAARLAEEALGITERSGYVLQGADVHLFLAELALAGGDRAAGLAHARAARRLAACDGPPDYTYKVAYDAAGALLARLGAGE
jgi:tetratricopeptide (TPR) repeat protein